MDLFCEITKPDQIDSVLDSLTIEDIKKASEGLPIFSSRKIFGKKCEFKKALFTSYFNSKGDPQRKTKIVGKDNFDYIKEWYQSIDKLKLNAIVFHDNLSESFVKEYTTDRIIFIKCELGPYSLNDERFIIYLIYILEYGSNLESVFFTDGNDLIVKKIPFEIIKDHHKNTFFVGRDDTNYFYQSRVNRDVRIPLFENDLGHKLDIRFYFQTIYNAGILGGNKKVMLYFLYHLARLFVKCNSDHNHNMVALNYCIYKFWWSNVKEKNINTLLGGFIILFYPT